MDFQLSPRLAELRTQVRDFVERHVLPAERRIVDEDRRRDSTTLRALQAEARAAGLFVPHLPEAYGGLGLGVHRQSAVPARCALI